MNNNSKGKGNLLVYGFDYMVVASTVNGFF